jgi:DNA-binding response OmpR family regulator
MLISSDSEIERAIHEAAREMDIMVYVSRTAHEAVREFTHGFEKFSLILVDLDPEVHGVTLFNALDDCHGKAPIVALTGCEESYMKPLVMAGGAADCLGKPITAACFQRLFESYCTIRSS